MFPDISYTYTAKFLRGETFAVGIEKDRSRENIRGWVKNHENRESFAIIYSRQ